METRSQHSWRGDTSGRTERVGLHPALGFPGQRYYATASHEKLTVMSHLTLPQETTNHKHNHQRNGKTHNMIPGMACMSGIASPTCMYHLRMYVHACTWIKDFKSIPTSHSDKRQELARQMWGVNSVTT